jgi:hypothetical protein
MSARSPNVHGEPDLLVNAPRGSVVAVLAAEGEVLADGLGVGCGDARSVLVVPLVVAHSRRGRGPDPDWGRGALDLLARSRSAGITHLALSAPAQRWLGRYPELAAYLEATARAIAEGPEGALWQLAPPPAPGPPKVFAIGLTKTGTSSLHRALSELGFKSLHWGGRAAYFAVLDAQRGGRRLLAQVGEQHDAYSDIETLSVRFDIAALHYPGSRFILTVRDVDEWIDSRRHHVLRNRRALHSGTYQGTNIEIHEEQWRRQWAVHIERVMSWFAGRDDLLVLDICRGEGWERLAPFLRKPVPARPFPVDGVFRPTERTTPVYLARGPDGVLLVEGTRPRRVADDVTPALVDMLGLPAVAPPEVLGRATAQSHNAIGFVPHVSLAALVAAAPAGARVAIVNESGDVQMLDEQGAVVADPRHSARGGTPSPVVPTARDQLAIASDAGVTHLVVPRSPGWWLHNQPDLAHHLAHHGSLRTVSAAGGLWALPPSAGHGAPKVFGIGLPHTGASALRRALTMLRIDTFPGDGPVAYHATLAAHRAGERLLERVGESHDAYVNIAALSARFEVADVQYPGSRFVLTVCDIDRWVAARRAEVRARARDSDVGSSQLGDEDEWRQQWTDLLARASSWFAGRDDLLVLDLSSGDGWERLAPFLGAAIPRRRFPPYEPTPMRRLAWRARRRVIGALRR